MEKTANVFMIAKVTCVACDHLLVCECNTHQEVLVRTNHARCFSRGDCICIRFNGAMTMSIPPQITAICIELHPPCID